jgi:LysR family transcriptional regulator, glycine cleavage system transcriptional activator
MSSAGRVAPLYPLRVLEACARHGSFSKAAAELGVTPGAVTQQIRIIEDWAGAPLFRRTGRAVELTDIMQAALPALSDAFQKLSEAGFMLRAPQRTATAVTVSAPPSFAAKWLVPRLDRFREAHPSFDVWVHADAALIDFSTTGIDVAIRYGAGLYDGLNVEKLLAERIRPVAAPHLLARLGGHPASPAMLAELPLLHDSNAESDPTCPDWATWLAARGARTASLPGARYNQSSLVIEEAVAGKGIALAKLAIAEADLKAGRLVALFDDTQAVAFAYWLVWPRGRTLHPPARAFLAWLRAEAVGDLLDGAGI